MRIKINPSMPSAVEFVAWINEHTDHSASLNLTFGTNTVDGADTHYDATADAALDELFEQFMAAASK